MMLTAAVSREGSRRPVQEARVQPQELASGGDAQAADTDITAMLPPADDAVSLPAGRRTRASVLKRDSLILAVTPTGDIEFTKVRALLPDGSVLLLAEISGFRKAAGRTLVYRRPVRLPKGTRIVAEPRVGVELVIASPEP